MFDLSGKIIRPDVYFIEYEYNYIDLTTKTNKTIKAKRPICVLSERGDVSLTTLPLLNANDASELKNKWTTIGSKNSLFAFRVADVNMTTVPLLNVNDASELARKWASGFQEFYTTLK